MYCSTFNILAFWCGVWFQRHLSFSAASSAVELLLPSCPRVFWRTSLLEPEWPGPCGTLLPAGKKNGGRLQSGSCPRPRGHSLKRQLASKISGGPRTKNGGRTIMEPTCCGMFFLSCYDFASPLHGFHFFGVSKSPHSQCWWKFRWVRGFLIKNVSVFWKYFSK